MSRSSPPGGLATLLFPVPCPACGRPGEPLCRPCAARLRRPPPGPPPPGLDAWVAVAAYEGPARVLVAGVKYRQARAALPWLASALARVVRAEAGPVDAVTWAPTTPARRRARGFDHAELLARGVGRDLGLPVLALLARRPGTPQTGLPAARRREGPVFAPSRRGVPHRLLVVDDVVTTGATLQAAAAALRVAGARVVVAGTVARTP